MPVAAVLWELWQPALTWEQRKLGEISNTFSGGTPSASNKKYYGGDIPFIRSAEINTNSTQLNLSEEGLKNSSAKRIKRGTLLYALYGATSGEVGIAKIDGAINQAVMAIILKNDNKYFIKYWLAKNKNRIKSKYLQGGQGNLSAKIVNFLSISLPTSREENCIGKLMFKIDNLIALQQRKLELLNSIKKATLQSIFANQYHSMPQLRFKGFAVDWKYVPINKVFKKSTAKNQLLEYGYDDVISVAKMHWNKNVNKDKGDSYLKTYNIFKQNSIAYEGNRSNHFRFGRFVLNDIGNGIVSHVFPVYEPTTKFDTYFMKYYIHDESAMYSVLLHSTTSTLMMHSIQNKSLLKQKLRIPPIEEQTKIGSFLKNVEQAIQFQDKYLNQLNKLRTSLLQKMFI